MSRVERAGTVSEKEPSGPVIVPLTVGASLTTMVAPINGLPCSSVTLPETVRSAGRAASTAVAAAGFSSARADAERQHNKSRRTHVRLPAREE